MKAQLTFSDIEYAERKRASRREIFLQKMDVLTPWDELTAVIRSHYYPGKRGRPPCGIETMLRMYFLQLWYNMSDEMTEESIYDSRAMKEFMGIDFSEEDVPDATIIEAPTSTKNSSKSRDPEMHQTKKGNQWHHGMKAHIGADVGTGMVHSLAVTAANVADVTEASKLVRKDDEFASLDAGYIGVEKREEVCGDERLSAIDWRVSLHKNVLGHLDWVGQPRWDAIIAYLNTKVRSKVEHSFHIVKNLFGYRKMRYRGLEKNGASLYMLFGLANMYRWSWRMKSLGARPVTA